MRLFCLLMGLAAALGASPPPTASPVPKQTPPPNPPGIRVLSEITLPPAFEWANDVRWASDKSVYLGVSVDGTVEMSLDPAGPPPKEMIPGRSKPGGFWASQRIAASSQYLAAAGPALAVTWRHLTDPTREEAAFDFIQGIDIWENRFVMLGARRAEDGKFAPEGAIAWTGTLDKKLVDLRPFLYDVAGPGAPNMGRCGSAPLGAIRFLSDGSLLVVPGVQPGVNLYDVNGKLTRTWDTASLGVDGACGSLTDLQAHKIMGPAAERNAWLNQWHTVDTVLPLPEGPGLVVRRAERGHTRWELKLLRLKGGIQSFEVPIEENSEFFHIAGDVRGGKVVLLLSETVFRGSGKDHPAPPRLIIAEPSVSLEK